MRIRASHIAVAVLALIGGFFLFAMMENGGKPSSAESTSGTAPGAALPPIDRPGDMPKIEFETTDFSVGLIDNDHIGAGKLKVYNRGTAPLTIGEIRTSCGCTQGTIPPARATIPPGGESWIDVTVDPKRVPGFESHKVLTVYSNDAKTPAVAVNVASKIKPEFDVPAVIDFGEVHKGQARENTIKMRQIGAQPLEVQSVEELLADKINEKPHTDITYAFKKLPEAEWQTPGKAEYAITVKLGPDVPPGALTRFMVINSNITRLPKFRVQIKATIAGFYKIQPAYPERLMLRVPGGATYEKGSATIQSDRPIEISDLKFDESKLKATVRNGDSPSTKYIDVEIAPTAQRGRIDEEIKFTIKGGNETYNDKIAARAYITRVTPSPAAK